MVMLQKWKENGHTEVVSFMEGVVILQGCSLQWSESGHVTEVVSLREGEWSCYGDVQYKEGRMVMLESWPV